MAVELLILARMFGYPPSPELVSALAPYFAAYSGLVAVVVLGAYGLASYVNQILPAKNGST